jgi:ABC-2 type transport system permease protein
VRLVRLFVGGFSISLRRELAYRANLLFQVLLTGVGIASGLAVLGIVYSRTETLAGWSLAEAIVLFGTYGIVSGMLATFIEPNMAWFTTQVKSGKLDDVLLKPVPSIFLSSLGTCAPLGLSEVVLGVVVLGMGIHELRSIPTMWGAIGWLLMLAVAIVITWASRVLLASLVFWAPHVELDVLYRALWQFGRSPVSIYQQPIRSILTYVVPIAFISTIPASALTRGARPELLLIGLAIGITAIVLVRRIWDLGLKRYTSATS